MSTNYEDRRRKIQDATPKDRTGAKIAAAVLVALLVLGGIVWAVMANMKDTRTTDETVAGATAPPNATEDGGGIVANPGKAQPGAPTLVVYEDFQCPICKEVEQRMGPTLHKLAGEGKIKLEFHMRSFLDENIKRFMDQQGKQVPNPDSSLRAAAAVSCADQAGAFLPYHDEVFKAQPEEGKGYSDDQLKNTFAKGAGLKDDKLTQFQKCVDEGAMKGYATKMEKVGGEQNNTGTPEWRLNGEKLDWNQFLDDPASLEKRIADATKK